MLLTHWTRQFAVAAATASLLLFSLTPLAASPQEIEINAKGRAALAATEAGRAEESFRLWSELLALGRARLGDEVYSFARSYIYRSAGMKIEELGDSDCKATIEWAEKGRKPGPPEYRDVFDVFYSVLLIAKGVCFAQLKQYEEAYTHLTDAKAELRQAPAEDAAEFLRQADHYLGLVQPHIISAGDYVTNLGVLQAWIGKVVSRTGNEVHVKITYANKNLAAGSIVQGATTPFSATSCKKLGAISPDALVRGWQD